MKKAAARLSMPDPPLVPRLPISMDAREIAGRISVPMNVNG